MVVGEYWWLVDGRCKVPYKYRSAVPWHMVRFLHCLDCSTLSIDVSEGYVAISWSLETLNCLIGIRIEDLFLQVQVEFSEAETIQIMSMSMSTACWVVGERDPRNVFFWLIPCSQPSAPPTTQLFLLLRTMYLALRSLSIQHYA